MLLISSYYYLPKHVKDYSRVVAIGHAEASIIAHTKEVSKDIRKVRADVRKALGPPDHYDAWQRSQWDGCPMGGRCSGHFAWECELCLAAAARVSATNPAPARTAAAACSARCFCSLLLTAALLRPLSRGPQLRIPRTT